MSNFDLSSIALSAVCADNAILTDGVGMPSCMVYLPAVSLSECLAKTSSRGGTLHPAFRVGSGLVSGVWVAKYPAVMYNGIPYSLPDRDPLYSGTISAAIAASEAKGQGWHMLTNAEWAAIALYCRKSGFFPYGNNSAGRDFRESAFRGRSITEFPSRSRIATGTGGPKYSHTGDFGGIFDLSGNLPELCSGIRLANGELQIIPLNLAAVGGCSQTLDSTDWRAVLGASAALVECSAAGGTPGALRLDFVDSKWCWTSGAVSSASATVRSCGFAAVTADESVSDDARELLYLLALLPEPSAEYEQDAFRCVNSAAEPLLLKRGGSFSDGAAAGVFCADFSSLWSDSLEAVAFRCAYVKGAAEGNQ